MRNVDKNEAPEGFIAIQDTGRHKCDICCFYGGCGKGTWACLPEQRRDGCSVTFKPYAPADEELIEALEEAEQCITHGPAWEGNSFKCVERIRAVIAKAKGLR